MTDETKTEASQAVDNAVVMARTPIRFKWVTVPNESLQQIHLDVILPHVSKHFSTCGAEWDNDEGQKLAECLESIHGIEEFWTDKYSLTVCKGEVFGWNEVKSRVESIVASFFGGELRPA